MENDLLLFCSFCAGFSVMVIVAVVSLCEAMLCLHDGGGPIANSCFPGSPDPDSLLTFNAGRQPITTFLHCGEACFQEDDSAVGLSR